MRRVILESPYGGNVELNERYARDAMRECLLRGESPFASHLLYTQPRVLNDLVPAERELGINAGFEWREGADKTVVYIDKGISKGMHLGIADSAVKRVPVEFRMLGRTEPIECRIERGSQSLCYLFYVEGQAPFSHFVNL